MVFQGVTRCRSGVNFMLSASVRDLLLKPAFKLIPELLPGQTRGSNQEQPDACLC